MKNERSAIPEVFPGIPSVQLRELKINTYQTTVKNKEIK
jgi:hypothetical protein